MEPEGTLTRAPLKAPRAGAIAGIVFSTLLIISLVLIRISVPANPQDAGTWLSVNWKTVRLALHLLPFAGIAFLWFIGVLRDRIGAYEDRFFATVFLGSGLLFLAMTFAAAATAAAIVAVYTRNPSEFANSTTYVYARSVVAQIFSVYALRMAAVFLISQATLWIRTRVMPRWMALLTYGLALVLLFIFTQSSWVILVFPAWVFMVSAYILVTHLAGRRPSVT
jgi:hypothetical protein